MTPELLFFILRVALAVALYAFLGAVVYLLWRDVRAASETAAARQRRLGRLVAITTPTGALRSDPLPSGDELAKTVFPLLPITSVGRAPTNTVTLADEVVSLEHALLTRRGGQWWLEDLGSRNGTTLNGAKIAGPVAVSAGDVIGVGRTRLKLELE